MKNFIISILFLTYSWAGNPISNYQRGGSINAIEQNIAHLEEQQKTIEEHLSAISSLLSDYNTFDRTYLSRIQSILKQGADCLISEQEYLYYEKTLGEKSEYTLMHKKFKDECISMKEERMKSLEGLDHKFTGLEAKVKELRMQQKIDMKREGRIHKYIQALKADRAAIVG